MTEKLKLEDLEVYKEALLLVKEVFHLCTLNSLKYEYSLCDQIKRASASVCANIAEGYGRGTKAELARFLSIALGSNNETLAFLDIISITKQVDTTFLKGRYNLLGKRIYAFKRKLQS